MADSFDRTHKQVVKNIRAEISGNKVKLKLECDKNAKPEIELWNLERLKGLFEEVFDKKIKVKCL